MPSRRVWFLIAMLAPAIGVASVACGSQDFSAADDDAGSGSDANAGGDVVGDGASSDAPNLDASFDASSGPFCLSISPPPLFCADFDEGDYVNGYSSGTLGPVFTSSSLSDGGTLAAQSGGLSPPNLLVSELPSGAGVAQALANAQLGMAGLKLHYRLDLEFKFGVLPPVPASGELQLFALQLNEDGTAASLKCSILINSSGLAYGLVDSSRLIQNIGDPPAAGTWTHATIDVSFVTGIVVFDVEGYKAQKHGISENSTYEQPLISLGADSPGVTGEIDVRYDNVTLVANDAVDGG